MCWGLIVVVVVDRCVFVLVELLIVGLRKRMKIDGIYVVCVYSWIF